MADPHDTQKVVVGFTEDDGWLRVFRRFLMATTITARTRTASKPAIIRPFLFRISRIDTGFSLMVNVTVTSCVLPPPAAIVIL